MSSCSSSSSDALNPSKAKHPLRVRRPDAPRIRRSPRRRPRPLSALPRNSGRAAPRPRPVLRRFASARSMFSQISNRSARPSPPARSPRSGRFSARQQRRADAWSYPRRGFQPLPVRVKPTRYAPSTCISSALSASTSSIRTPPAPSSTSVSVCARTRSFPSRRGYPAAPPAQGSASARRWAASRASSGVICDLNRPAFSCNSCRLVWSLPKAPRPSLCRRIRDRRQQRRDRRARLHALLGMQLADRAPGSAPACVSPSRRQLTAALRRRSPRPYRRPPALYATAVDFRPQRPSRVVRTERPVLDFPAQHIHFSSMLTLFPPSDVPYPIFRPSCPLVLRPAAAPSFSRAPARPNRADGRVLPFRQLFTAHAVHKNAPEPAFFPLVERVQTRQKRFPG